MEKMKKGYYGLREAIKYIKDEDAIITHLTVMKDGSISADVEIFLYLKNGDVYSTHRKVRLKK